MSEQEYRNELQQISATLQQFDEYGKKLQIDMETLRSYSVDLSRSKKTLENLKEEKDPSETLMQLGSGIMIKAKPLEKDTVYYNVGAGVIITKTYEEAIKDLNKRIEEVETQSKSLVDQLSQIQGQMTALEQRGQQLLQKLQGPAKAQYDPDLVS